jgi:hypothetical protein
MTTFLGELATGFLRVLQRVLVAFESPSGVRALINDFGWDAPLLKADADALRNALNAAELAFQAGETLVEQLEAGTVDEIAIAEKLIQAAVPLSQAIAQLSNLPTGGLAAPFDQSAFWQQMAEQLLDYLLLTYLETEHPLIAAIVYGLGLADITPQTPTGLNRIPYKKRTIDWSHLSDLVTAPMDHLAQTYHWNDAATPFDHSKLLTAVANLSEAARLPVRFEAPRPGFLTDYYTNTNPSLNTVKELSIPVASMNHADPTTFAEFGLVMLPIPPDGQKDQAPVGFLLAPRASGVLSGLPSGAPFALSLTGGFDAEDSVRLEVRPHSFKLGLPPGGIKIDAGISVAGRPAKPWIVIGGLGSHRVELGGIRAGIRVHGPLVDPEISVEAGTGEGPSSDLGGASLILDFKDSDGFLQKMLGSGTERLDFALLASWSNKHGFGFSGQAQLEANFAVHLSIAGVLNIDTVYIAIGPGVEPHTAALTGAVAGGLTLGPVAATVDRVGLALNLKPDANGTGNLGKLDIGFGFKPPNGLGLLIDAGPVVGGGYIFFDPNKGQYAGVLELSLEFVQIKAIGLLDTVLPDGSHGFSFLLIITTEFTPIQLGFGFTLNGVGGLAGINRTMVLDVLRAGLKNHDLNSILFPPDPIKNARQIISDLSHIFPPSESRYVFGPMLEIGYGSPSLVIAEIGIVLEIPSPVRLAILGQIRAVIPTDKAAVIIIHLDVLGTIDFGLEKLSIDATIYDSRIAAFALLGDMALRLNWGADPQFAFSLGGLNAQFQPPPAFPKLHRLTVSVGDGENPRLSLETYVAITSNTFQFGADLELLIVEGSISVHGYMKFDALFIFSPFHFAVEMQAGVDIKVSGTSLLSISLDLLLQGPTPWIFDGTASISFLFFSISVHVHGSFGTGTPETLPAAPVMPPLIADLNKASSWSATLPGGIDRSVSFLGLRPDDTSIVVHPVGLLTLREKVVPLTTPITRFGSTAPSDGDEFEIGVVTVGGAVETTSPVRDQFAIAQFKELSDADKLSAPSYQPFPGGVSIGSNEVKPGKRSDLDLHYDTQIIDDALLPARTGSIYKVRQDVLLALGGQSAAGLAPARHTGKAKFAADDTGSPISNEPMGYVIVGTEDLTARYDILGGSTNHYMASYYLAAHLRNHPEDTGSLLVLPQHEAAA